MSKKKRKPKVTSQFGISGGEFIEFPKSLKVIMGKPNKRIICTDDGYTDRD